MADQDQNETGPPAEDNAPETSEGNKDEEEKEYNVEAIRAKRYDKSGHLEYYIKWEGYPETENTWEPIDHLECPDLLAKFEEEQQEMRPKKTTRRTRSKTTSLDPQKPSTSRNKRPKRDCTLNNSYHQRAGDALLELNGNHDSDGSSNSTTDTETETCALDIQNKKQQAQENEQNSQPEVAKQIAQPEEKIIPKGFGRGLELDTILSACVDDSKTLWFLVKWKNGPNDVELIESKEVEEKAPQQLCAWYRKRLYYTVKLPSESNVIQMVDLSDSPEG